MIKVVSGEIAGWRSAGVIEALEFACDEKDIEVVIQHRHGILAAGQATSSSVDLLAIEQGLVAILVGIAQEKGFLEIWDHLNHHLPPEWTLLSPWDEAKLSIETVLTMTTGMDDSLSLAGEINKTWRVNPVAYGYLKSLLEVVTGQSLAEISRAWLFEPLGMTGAQWFSRQQTLPDGAPVMGLAASASDLVKLGQMLLQRGQFAGTTVMSEAHYLDDMLRPGSEQNPAWAWLWWLNNGSHFMLPGSAATLVGVPVPAAPKDLYVTRAGNGSFLAVVPSLDLVVVRTIGAGSAQTDASLTIQSLAFENEFWKCLLSATTLVNNA